MKIWVAFLLVSLLWFAAAARRDRVGGGLLLLGGCMCVAVLLSTYRFV